MLSLNFRRRFWGATLPIFQTKSGFSHASSFSSFTDRHSMEGTLGEQEKDYHSWSHSDLIQRVRQLESTIQDHGIIVPPQSLARSFQVPGTTPPEPKKKRRSFNAKQYSTRLIALKIAYLGGNYNGFEYHTNNPTPLPTIEEKIFAALLKARLVSPSESQLLSSSDTTTISDASAITLWPGDDAVQYSKCGRTDKGVSAFGQVIGVRVRSNRPIIEAPDCEERQNQIEDITQDIAPPKPFDDIKDELPYVQILNRLLPDDIQVLAWCPNPPEDFSARHNCRSRYYRYFFINPAMPPPASPNTDSPSGEGWLNIPKMRQAASYFLGEHDFRNFCKLDPSKQVSNFKRHIFHSDIEECTPLPNCNSPTHTSTDWSLINPLTATSTIPTPQPQPKIYLFHLHGTAFLWHQVRHMVAILFLIGQGLESPELVKQLLDVDTNPCKPGYEMADDQPLILWDCTFPENEIHWIYGEKTTNRFRRDALVDTVWGLWYRSRIDELLRAGLVDKVSEAKTEYQEKEKVSQEDEFEALKTPPLAHSDTFGKGELNPISSFSSSKSQVLVGGGGKILLRGKYVPILERKRQEHIDVLNERYRNRKPEKAGGMGKAKREKMRRMMQEEENVQVQVVENSNV